MRARLVVFPVRGRNWCFSRSIDQSASSSAFSQSPSTFKELWNDVSFSDKRINTNAELVVDFTSKKLNSAWVGLEKAPDGSLMNKIYGLGLKLLSRVNPSETFLKSISKEVTEVEVIYPSSLNARLVRRRLRHIALRGIVIHKKYFYGSMLLLPLTSALAVLPLPNFPFFWNLFRTYCHWRALEGSQKLVGLLSDRAKDSKYDFTWSVQPSEELEKILQEKKGHEDLSENDLLDICKIYDLNGTDVIKCRYSHKM